MLIDHALAGYQEVDRLSREIEQALQTENLGAISSLFLAMNTLQETIKDQDRQVLDMVRSRPDIAENGQLEKLLHLMRTIAERNQRLLPRINAIMAVQRDEMGKLNTGNTLLKGYRNLPWKSGGRISSSN